MYWNELVKRFMIFLYIFEIKILSQYVYTIDIIQTACYQTKCENVILRSLGQGHSAT
jgi:hypothetical protein